MVIVNNKCFYNCIFMFYSCLLCSQATLGDFNVLKPSINQKQYSLLGITNKVPQTPVDAGNNKTFSFDGNLHNKSENTPDRNLAKVQKTKPQIRTKEEKPRNDSTLNSTVKKTVDASDQHGKMTKTVSKKLSDTDHSLLDSSILKKVKNNKVSLKKETSPTNSEGPKHDQHVNKATVKKETSSINSEAPKHDQQTSKVSVKKETSPTTSDGSKHDQHTSSLKKETSTNSEAPKHDQHVNKVQVKEPSSISSELSKHDHHVAKVPAKNETFSTSNEVLKHDHHNGKISSSKQDHLVGKTSVKRETSSTSSNISQEDHHVLSNGIDEKITNVKKEVKDNMAKHKPPKLSIKPRYASVL